MAEGEESGESSIKEKLKDAKDWATTYKGSGKKAAWLFTIAVFLQFYDIFVSFNRSSLLPSIVLFYLFLAIFAYFVFREGGHFVDIKKIFLFLFISAYHVVIPTYLYIFRIGNLTGAGGLDLSQWAGFLMAILPVWPIYIGLHDTTDAKLFGKTLSGWVHFYVNFWILFIIFLFIFSFSANINAGDIANIGGKTEVIQITSVWDYLVQKTLDTAAGVWKGTMNFIDPPCRGAQCGTKVLWIDKIFNASGINYYTGNPEQNEKVAVGLELSLPRADKAYYVGSPVTIWSDIKGKSFTDEIIVVPSCFIDKVGDGVADKASISLFGTETDSISCTFNDLPKGSYRANIGIAFNYDTWAYTTYNFVDREVRRSMESQGKNINSEFDIPIYPEAIFTKGPVMLGMGNMMSQPISIDRIANQAEPALGVTLSNYWTEGAIAQVDEFYIMIPNDFALSYCDRISDDPEKHIIELSEEETHEIPDSYIAYKFDRDDLGEIREQFQSITCRLKLKDPKEFLKGQQSVQRTFVSRVRYIYSLKKSVSIYVKE